MRVSKNSFIGCLLYCIELECLSMEICAKYLNYHLTISIECENFYLLDQDKKVSDYSKYITVKIFHQWLRIFFCTGFLIIVYFKKKILNKSCVAWRFDGIFFTQIHPILSCKYALWIEHLYKLNQSIMALFYSDLWLTKLIKLGCQMLWQFILIKVHRKSLL